MQRWILRLGLLWVAAAIIPACGSSSSSGGGLVSPGGSGPGVVAEFLLGMSQGGEALAGDGGDGGNFNVDVSTGSDLRMLTTGTVNSVVVAPTIAPNLGSNPRIVDTDETWSIANGELSFGDSNVAGNNPIFDATGLWVKEGVTLTLDANIEGPPAVPQNVAADAGNAEVLITWDPAAGANNYSIYRQVNGTGGFALLAGGIGSGGTNSYRDSTVNNTDTYEYTVVANNGFASSAPSAPSNVADTDLAGTTVVDPPIGTALPGLGFDLYLSFENSVFIEGTVRVGHRDALAQGDQGSDDAANFDLEINENLVVGANGLIDVSGKDDATGDGDGFGGDGGYFALEGNYADSDAWTIILNGRIDTTGGDGDGADGGDGGDVYVDSDDYGIYHGGTIDSSGGSTDADDGFGGDAGDITLRSNTNGEPGGVFNSGDLIAVGGDGAEGGGDGGQIFLEADEVGAVTSSGDIDSSGGAGTNGVAFPNPPGGDAGSITLTTDGGTVRVTGTLTARGGDGADDGDGGDGNDINLTATNNSGIQGTVAFGADYQNSGGTGGFNGGNAGNVNINVSSTDTFTPGQDIVWIVGFDEINVSGGPGTDSGGDSGSIAVFNGMASNNNLQYQGSLRNEVMLVARGGAGDNAFGGDAGDVDLTTDDQANTVHSLVNTGEIDARGGDSNNDFGGLGGIVFVASKFLVDNSAEIQVSGGTGGGDVGGDGGGIQLLSLSAISNTADLSANGGTSSASDGGLGGVVLMFAPATTSAGDLNARGGVGGSGQAGGTGGTIELRSSERPTNVTGTLSVAKGTPAPSTPVDSHGTILIDGVIMPLTNGSYTP